MGTAHTQSAGRQAPAGEAVEFDLSALLAEMDQGQTADGVTVAELSDRLNKSEPWVRGKLGRLIAEGKCKLAGHRVGTRIDGRACQIPVYRLVKQS